MKLTIWCLLLLIMGSIRGQEQGSQWDDNELALYENRYNSSLEMGKSLRQTFNWINLFMPHMWFKGSNWYIPQVTTRRSVAQEHDHIRSNKHKKGLDLIVKMTADFITDMHQKMLMIRKVEMFYDKSHDYTTAVLLQDITDRFKHMCLLYKQFATTDRMLFENSNYHDLTNDVAVIYELILTDYNELLMMMRIFKREREKHKWHVEREDQRALVKQHLQKFKDIPSAMTKTNPRKALLYGHTGVIQVQKLTENLPNAIDHLMLIQKINFNSNFSSNTLFRNSIASGEESRHERSVDAILSCSLASLFVMLLPESKESWRE